MTGAQAKECIATLPVVFAPDTTITFKKDDGTTIGRIVIDDTGDVLWMETTETLAASFDAHIIEHWFGAKS